MKIRRNRPVIRREAFASYMWYPPMGGDLRFLPSYGGEEDTIEFKSSVDEMKSEPVAGGGGGGKTSLADWLGLGKEVFQLVNGVWTKVRDKQGRPVREVVTAPPPPNYTPLIVGGIALTVLVIGGVALLRSK